MLLYEIAANRPAQDDIASGTKKRPLEDKDSRPSMKRHKQRSRRAGRRMGFQQVNKNGWPH